MDLHPGEKVVYEGGPVWRSILSFYVAGILAALVIAVVVGLFTDSGTAVVVWIAGVVVVVVAGLVKRVGTRYVITNQRLHIKRGILGRHVQQTRIERVQNVNTSQSFLDRVLRVGSVDFDTAGTDDSDFVFFGVSRPDEVVAAVDRAQRELRQSQ
jgi:uncharacterized membrane protein YdbT with pleckstrin-like domain